MKTIKEKNRLIAEFMGHEFKLVKNPTICVDGVSHIDDVAAVIDGRLVFTNNLRYHTSWDWLMPVVEKIESIGYSVKIQRIKTSIHRILEDAELFGFVCGDVSKKREITYDTIVKFIEWYNENK